MRSLTFNIAYWFLSIGYGLTAAFAALAPGRPLALRWQPRVTRLAGDLVVECDANIIAAAIESPQRLMTLRFEYYPYVPTTT